VPLSVIFLGSPDNQIHDIGEATAATAALFHRMVDLDRNDQLPTVLAEELDDRILDLPFGDVIATANQHFKSTWRTLTSIQSFLQKRTSDVKKESGLMLDISHTPYQRSVIPGREAQRTVLSE
jgi:hypothetical protein